MLQKLAGIALICLAAPAQAEVSSAEITYQSCRVCHDTAKGATITPLVGRSAEDLGAAFAQMAENPAAQSIMHRFLVGLSDQEIADLTLYIATLAGERK